jgi:glycosyltransferase involved in cell wall biosynthesis
MSSEHSPLVSVILPVYNGEKYLRAAVESILSQTLQDFELILIDDGSTDATPSILDSFTDPRIVRLKNDRNLGLTRSLNLGLRAARGVYLARQDADDLSLPPRLERQVAFLEERSEVGLVGAATRVIDENGALLRHWAPVSEPEALQQILLQNIQFQHGTFLFRAACLDDLGGGYDETMPVAQDCDLLYRLSERWELANLTEPLYCFRVHPGSISSNQRSRQERYLERTRRAAVKRRLAYGWSRLGLKPAGLPKWVKEAPRGWLARRYVCWSMGARGLSKGWALQLLLIAALLDPLSPELWSYLGGILRRKAGKAQALLNRPT